MTIEQVYNDMISRQYFHDKYRPLINSEKDFKKALYEVLSIWEAEHKKEIAELEAKVFAYEEIIKKSNFRPFVIDDPTYEETSKNENPSPEEMDATMRYYKSLGR